MQSLFNTVMYLQALHLSYFLFNYIQATPAQQGHDSLWSIIFCLRHVRDFYANSYSLAYRDSAQLKQSTSSINLLNE